MEWIMKKSSLRESPIACDTLLITDAESWVKHRVSKLLLECSMQQLHNEIIASPDDGGLLGARHAETNDVIISETILCSLAPPQLRPITYHHKCAICNTSKYFQESLNACWWKQLKIMKDKAEHSRRGRKYELTQAYQSYADYAFPNNETCQPRWENAADYILC